MSMRHYGACLSTAALLVIVYNVVESYNNVKLVERDGVFAFWSGEVKNCYTFNPPFAGFEVVVLMVLGIGVLMIAFDFGQGRHRRRRTVGDVGEQDAPMPPSE